MDGSAYLIDIDSNGTVDVISMLLLDQGFFDTNSEINIIGDPLIPIETESAINPANVSSTNGDNQGENITKTKLNNLSSTALSSLNTKKANNYSSYKEKARSKSPKASDLFEYNEKNENKEIKVFNPIKKDIGDNSLSILDKFKNNISDLKNQIDSYFEEFNNNQFLSIQVHFSFDWRMEFSQQPKSKYKL